LFQVLAPNDVQFSLPSEDEKEVVINANSLSNSLCVDTAAFVGVTVTFLMILIVALITIFFLWCQCYKTFYGRFLQIMRNTCCLV
jgi:hypothetical protein